MRLGLYWFLVVILTGQSVLFAGRKYNTGSSRVTLPTKQQIVRGKKSIKLPKNLKITPEWERLLNPAYEEYWYEGCYLLRYTDRLFLQ